MIFMRFRVSHLLLAMIPIALVCFIVAGARQARTAAQQSTCHSRMFEKAVHLLNYRDRNGRYPPAIFTGNGATPLCSWRALLYQEMDPDFAKTYNFAQPWNNPRNLAAAQLMTSAFGCPTNQGAHPRFTNYVAVIDHGVSTLDRAELIPKGHPDGAKQVLFIEYPNSDILPTEPRDLDIDDLSKLTIGADPAGLGVIFANTTFQRVSLQELRKRLGR